MCEKGECECECKCPNITICACPAMRGVSVSHCAGVCASLYVDLHAYGLMGLCRVLCVGVCVYARAYVCAYVYSYSLMYIHNTIHKQRNLVLV